jgi:cbb3-type cytochrome oxidase cytochrome c subunit
VPSRRTLYEQHNPDYIPAERGGPAIVLADSERDRVVEYQRVDEEWRQSWEWSDNETDWPRDADRLPNGNTLVTDSLGDRVLQVNRNGDVVWSVEVGVPYEAERLGTGDESAGGPSARAANLSAVSAEKGMASLVPPRIRHGVQWVVPGWMGVQEVAALLAYLTALCAFLYVEVRPRLGTLRERASV